jgi:hypothetical protein
MMMMLLGTKMRPSTCLLLTALTISFHHHHGQVSGFPTAVGSCAAGTEALLQTTSIVDLQTHGILNQIGGGPLSDYGIIMRLNGEALDENLLVSKDFTTGDDHSLSFTIADESQTFSGFLIRMDSVGDDSIRTVDAILPIESIDPDTNMTTTGGVKIPTECRLGELVAGVSHEDATPKRAVNVNLNMADETVGLELDVTVVIQTSISQNISHWYYSRFILNAVKPEGVPTSTPETEGPTQAPTPGPVAETEEEAPTASPAGSSRANNNNFVGWLLVSSLAVPVLCALGSL